MPLKSRVTTVGMKPFPVSHSSLPSPSDFELPSLSSDELVSETKRLVCEERRIGLDVLAHLREVDRRRLYLERGHSSLFSFCLRELGYSEPQAQLRIDAMRALRDTPGIEVKVRSGELPVTSVAKVQRFIRKEKIRTGQALPATERLTLFTQVQGKSSRQIERILFEVSPESALPKERERVISESHSEIRLIIPEDLREQLETLKALYSHRMKDPHSTGELLRILAADALKKAKPLRIASEEPSENCIQVMTDPVMPDRIIAPISPQVKVASNVNAVGKVNTARSRYVAISRKRQVLRRDGGRCSFTDSATGQRCGSTHFLQIDHVLPYSSGGSSRDTENLRLLCGPHNRLMWRWWKEGGGNLAGRNSGDSRNMR